MRERSVYNSTDKLRGSSKQTINSQVPLFQQRAVQNGQVSWEIELPASVKMQYVPWDFSRVKDEIQQLRMCMLPPRMPHSKTVFFWKQHASRTCTLWTTSMLHVYTHLLFVPPLGNSIWFLFPINRIRVTIIVGCTAWILHFLVIPFLCLHIVFYTQYVFVQ